LLCLGTGRIETSDEALAIDADAGVTALEVELAAERRRIGIVFEGIEAESVLSTGRAYRTVEFLLALSDAAKRRAELTDGAVCIRRTQASFRRGLRFAFVPLAQKATAVAQRPVGNTNIAGVPVTAGDPK
jgi:hypothetical protein